MGAVGAVHGKIDTAGHGCTEHLRITAEGVVDSLQYIFQKVGIRSGTGETSHFLVIEKTDQIDTVAPLSFYQRLKEGAHRGEVIKARA